MRKLLFTLALLAILSGTAHAENMDTPEAILLDQDRLNNEQADRQIEAVQKQIDNLDQMNRESEPDRYEAEDLDHARWMWDQQR
jgi:hypothetical protein